MFLLWSFKWEIKQKSGKSYNDCNDIDAKEKLSSFEENFDWLKWNRVQDIIIQYLIFTVEHFFQSKFVILVLVKNSISFKILNFSKLIKVMKALLNIKAHKWHKNAWNLFKATVKNLSKIPETFHHFSPPKILPPNKEKKSYEWMMFTQSSNRHTKKV